ncbi:MAG: bile acid:sodium symporter family protein [Bacteroidota bacterium]
MDSLSTLILVAALSIIMMGMGLSLTIDDFKRVLKYPLAVFIGFLNQIILLPLIGYGLIVLMGVESNIAIGVMILAACPGGSTSNLLTHLAKGDTALSVTLTAVNSLITIITIPLITNFALAEFTSEATAIDAPIDKIAGSLVIVVAIPLAIGMLIKRFASKLADKMYQPVRIASAIVLILVIVGLVIKERENLPYYFENAWVIVLSLNVVTMITGYVIGKIVGLDFRQSLTIGIESGNQNGTLAIHVAVVSLARPDLAIAAAVYSLLMYFTALYPIWLGNKKAK